MSRHTSPATVDGAASKASGAPPADSTASIFGRMMSGTSVLATSESAGLTVLRDRCKRPPRLYNDFYDPFHPERDDLPSDYSPYANGQPLFDDRAIDLSKIPRGKSLAPANKKPRRSWVWELGYTLIDLTHPKRPQFWACKGCKLRKR